MLMLPVNSSSASSFFFVSVFSFSILQLHYNLSSKLINLISKSTCTCAHRHMLNSTVVTPRHLLTMAWRIIRNDILLWLCCNLRR